jgi:hypothetical protein
MDRDGRRVTYCKTPVFITPKINDHIGSGCLPQVLNALQLTNTKLRFVENSPWLHHGNHLSSLGIAVGADFFI